MRKYLLTLVFGLLALTVYGSASGVVQAQQTRFTCVSVQMLQDGQPWSTEQRKLRRGSDGQYESYIVKFRITIRKPDGQFTPATNYDNGHRLVYNRPGSDWSSAVNQAGQPFVDLTELQTQSQTTVEMNVPIDNIGTWYYALEAVDDTDVIGPLGSGCPTQQGQDIPFSVTEDSSDVEDRLFAGRCEALDTVAESIFDSHFNCVWNTTSRGTEQYDASLDNANQSAFKQCINGIGPAGEILEQNRDYCYPYKVSVQVQTLGHLDVCDPNNTSVRCGANLECRGTGGTAIDPDAQFRCIYRSPLITQSGAACHLFYANNSQYPRECSLEALLECTRTADSTWRGECKQQSTSAVCVQEGQNQGCIERCKIDVGNNNGSEQDLANCEKAKCVVTQLGNLQCQTADSTDPNGGVTVTPTNGACNCPGAILGEDQNCSNPVFDTKRTEPGLQTRFNACVACVNQNNTWTDSLGCVETTASGLFTRILQIALGVVGGITLLRLIILGYQYNFTDKKADIREAAKDVIATLGGLLLILFSVVLLRIIGVNILDIVPPGFFGN